MIRDFRTSLSAFVLSLMVSGVSVLAQGTELKFGAREFDSELPVEITAEELVVDQENGSAVFSGDVTIRQGPISMAGNSVRVEYGIDPGTGKERITSIAMSEGVTFVSENETAESERATYSPTDGSLTMAGDVLLVQGITAISADRFDYSFVSGTGRVQGNVKTIFSPNGN